MKDLSWEMKCRLNSLYGKYCCDVNNLLKQDKERKQEDEKQEDAGE